MSLLRAAQGVSMIKLSAAAACAALATLAYAPAHAAVSFVSAHAVSNASADTNYGQSSYGQGFGTKTDDASSYQSGVFAASAANAISLGKGANSDNGAALEESTGTFSSNSSGLLDLAGFTSASTYGSGQTAEAYSEGQSVQYTFSVDTASVINLSYALSETYVDPYSSISLYLGATDFSSSLKNGSLAFNTSGNLSYNLSPGTYLLNLYSQEGDYAFASDGGSAFGNHEEQVTFDIAAAAPEPGLWALMLMSVGLAGLALRRRRDTVGLAA